MKVLLLAGSGESRRLAHKLADRPRFEVLASLAGATRFPKPLPVDTRIGGFGGYEGEKEFLVEGEFDAVIDGTHPFAARISKRTFQLCDELSIPYAQILRPEWTPAEGDDWTMIAAPQDAREHIPAGANVFLATGRSTLSGFANLADCRLICRQIDPPEGPFPFPNGEYLVGRPPFSVEDEIAIFRKFRIDVLVVKNAGGAPSRTKLDAARSLGIKVLMIERPAPAGGLVLEDVDAALSWLNEL
ncbi:cobalt-precorrin-6A reductase [Halocynthiibacter sp. C4]|uniref:cobalt-precorrin-6A reductase n=1 Tax=Halocynthiibacter sp. C4 TaxID=2992758 RepID=UPI00237B8613|nr:cobalt-precorrin-6A reductase [Halocynthiibacter sp. C4]MDE0589717.1 cobalt-precorrin-6A reductase [Halocynthiibacter sp. C4]